MSARKEWHPEKVRAGLTHPVIDGDGHWIEYAPVFAEKMRKAAGDKAAEGFLKSQRRIPDALSLSIAERRQHGIAMEGYWGRQSTNTRSGLPCSATDGARANYAPHIPMCWP